MAVYELIQEFTSSRDIHIKYKVKRRVDVGPSRGVLSCDCPGWTRRVAPDGSRSCKHTKAAAVMLKEEVASRQASINANRAAQVVRGVVEKEARKAAEPRLQPCAGELQPSPFDGIHRRRIILDD